MNQFNINGTEFGIGGVGYSIDNDLINLIICSSDNVFKNVTGSINSEWDWALHPPKIYLLGIPVKEKFIVLDKEYLEKSNTSLYLMGHHELTGVLEIVNDAIDILGKVNIMGEQTSISIHVEFNNL